MKINNIEDYITNPSSLRLSYSYHKYDNVESLYITQQGHDLHVDAIVDVLGRKYECYFDIDELGNISNYECPCPWCNEQSPCAHIGVVLMKLNELDISEIPYSFQNNKQERIAEERERIEREIRLKELRYKTRDSHFFIENQKQRYQSQMISFLQDEQYELEPYIKITRNEYFITYKVGNEKKYILKNISNFLNAIDEHEEVKYGKTMSFIHNEQVFDEFSQKQIHFMRIANKTYKAYQRERYYYYSGQGLVRDIPLEGQILDAFFDTYYGRSYNDFSLSESSDLIVFHLIKEDGFYLLNLEVKKNCYFGKDYLYYIYQKTKCLYVERIVGDEQGILRQLVEEVSQNDLPILESDFPDFYKYVLSPILDYIQLSTPIDIIENSYEDIRLYGDMNEQEEVVLRLDYVNSDGHIQKGFDQDFITNYQQDIVENYICKYAEHIDYDGHFAYLDVNSERTYEFMREGLPFLKDYCEIYVSQSLKQLGETANYSITVGVKLSGDLLSLDIESAQIPKKEMANVLDQYRRKKKFYRLKSGELLYLNSPELNELNDLMNEYHLDTKNMTNGKVSMDSYRMFAIDDDASHTEHIQMNRNDTFVKTLQKFKDIQFENYPVPQHYEGILRDYQKEGFQWLHTLRNYGFNGILADDMGLGKTLQVIALLESIASKRPSLVICPSSLIYNWEDEVHKFSDTLKVVCVVGNQFTRHDIIEHASDYQLLVTSYDYIRRDVEFYDKTKFNYVILDEAQYIKNQKTKNATSVKKIKAVHRLALTGTPIENSLAELWSIFDFLMPNYLFNYHYFNKHYESDIVKNQNEEKINKLKKLVTPFILRRNKKDVLKELPDKIETTQFIQFSEKENEMYLANLAQVNKDLQTVFNMETVNKVAILAMLTKLRQLCCEPRLVYEDIENCSSKLNSCIELISTLHESHQKVLLFSSFTTLLDMIAQELSNRHIPYYMLTGKTNKEERRELVDKFQKDETTVFLISLKAGGTGLNLTAAQAVIHYDPWWNVSAQNQATDRVYRIGQENKVQVFQLVMKDSIEEKILKLQEKKKELADAFVENNEGSLSRMSKDDIMQLFTMDA